MPDNEKRVCIPLEEREENEVDRLRKKIAKIQENCEDDFRLVREPRLTETRVKGIFVGSVQYSQYSPAPEITLVCINCSKTKNTTIDNVCPRCLGQMRKEKTSLGAGSRKQYFGEEHLYFSIKLSCCTNCNFAVANDEWDQ